MTTKGTGQLLIEEVARETRSIARLLPTIDLSVVRFLSQPLRRSAEMTVGNECRADSGETLLLRGSPPADRE
jgi:hypothetical protein